MKNKLFWVIALVLALTLSGGAYVYTYTTTTGTVDITEPTEDIATWEPAAIQPDWNTVLPPPSRGDVPTGDLFIVTVSPAYTGDLVVKVYLTNTGALIKAYQYLNMKLYLEGSVEATETPNYRLLTLQNGKVALNLEAPHDPTHTLSVIGGSYSLISADPPASITPEFYCEITQR